MKQPVRQTMEQSGYEYVSTMGGGNHLLRNKETLECEIWFSNKGRANYGIIWRNTTMEFSRKTDLQYVGTRKANAK